MPWVVVERWRPLTSDLLRRLPHVSKQVAGLAVTVATILISCSSPSFQARSDSRPSGERSAQRKSIVIAPARDLRGFGVFSMPDTEQADLVHAGLARMNATTMLEEPWAAEELPSLERGTWKVFPDATMETTYRLRPGIKWHDGTALSSRDFVFGLEVALDTKVPYQYRRQAEMMEQVETPDDRTLVIQWNSQYRLADRLIRTDLYALPRHIVEPLYRSGDYDRFLNAPFWLQDYVGTGPFRVATVQPGSTIELVAFDDYFLGRPKIDAVTLRLIDNVNVMLTNLLAGEIDVALNNGFTIDTGIVAKDQWEARGEGQIIFTPYNWSWVNPSALNPWLTDIRVRRALLHAINREEMVQSLSYGHDQVLHAPMSPFRAQFARVDAVVTKYEYSPARALALLDEAGWHKGPDGVLSNGQGERFSIEGRRRSDDYEQIQMATVGYWKPLGIDVVLNNNPSDVEVTPEFRNRWSGAYWQGHGYVVEEWSNRFSTDVIPTEANRWVGNNTSRWSTPEKELILKEMDATLSQQRWDDLSVEFCRLFSVELPHLPLKTNAVAMAVRKGITGVQPRSESGERNSRTWNVEQWDRV